MIEMEIWQFAVLCASAFAVGVAWEVFVLPWVFKRLSG